MQIEYLQVPGFTGLWTAGDCAAVPDGYETGMFFPPTAQHGMREALTAAKNIERTILGQPLQPFRYRTMGMLASIGHHTGVASFFGFKFSGFIAWWMWRSVYLAKLPRLVKKLRVMIAWTLDLLFGRDIEQMITLRDVEELSERWAPHSRTDARRSHGHDDRYCTGRHCRLALWRDSKFRHCLADAENTRQARRSSCRTPQTRSALRRIHQRMLEARAWIRSSKISINRKGCCRSTLYSTASGFAPPTRFLRGGSARDVDHRTIFLAQCLARTVA